MKTLLSSLNIARPIDAPLTEIIEATFGRLQAGEAIDIDALSAAHPQYAEQLRDLLPTIAALVRLGDLPAPASELLANGKLHTAGPPPHQQQLGDFRILRELGRGGMGTVFEAEQLTMGRRVALKVLPFAALAQDKALQRFRNEVRAAAALDHPHIVSVYSVGEERGVHFYAMQLICGQTLADMIHELRKERNPLPLPLPLPLASRVVLDPEGGGHTDDAPTIDSAAASLPSTQRVEQARVSTLGDSRQTAEYFRTAARLGIQAAEALQHAHDLGVLHRDIKPSNLMLDGEGKLYVTDFGLARIEADAGMTMTGDIVGTLRYMAPEQALAKRVVIDHRADVYSLGATLYELLTLQPAFGETDRSELLKQIAFEEPRALRKLDRRIPAELETIVLKAMAKNPDERYQTAQQLADDLRAFLEDRPIQAKPPTLLVRTAKWSRRHVAIVWSAAVVLLISTIVLTVASLQVTKWYREAEHQREFASSQLKEAQRQEQSARAVADFLQQMLASANPEQIKGANYTVRHLLDNFSNELGSRLTDQPEVEARLRAVVGKAYWRLAILDQAELHFKKALELHRSAGGTDSVSVGDVLADYAWNLYESGKSGEAFTCIQEALAIYRRNGSPRESMLNAMTTLHKFLIWNSRFQEADATAEEALAIAGDLDTVEIPSVASLVHGIASAKLSQGEYAAAEAMARRAVDLHRRLHGDQHPETAWGLSNLGSALKAQQKLAEAEAAQREALTIFRQYYGVEHKSIQLVNIRLARVLAAKGDLSGSKLLLNETIAGYEEAIRVGKADADGLSTLAWQLATADYDEIRDGRAAVEMAVKACEMSGYENAGIVDTLAAAYAEAGDFDAAVKWSEKAVELAPGVEDLAKHLDSFRSGRPWRQP